jgi:hypothetical protein
VTDDEAEAGRPAPRLRLLTKAQWRYFYASKNPKLRALATKESHKVIARRGKVTGYRSLPARKGIRRR